MRFAYFIVVAVLLLLAGCSSVPLTSLPKLARIDFMTTDLHAMRVAVALPPSLSPQPRGVVLDLKLQQGAMPAQEEHLKLEEIKGSQADLGLPSPPAETPHLHVYALSPEDAVRLEQMRAEVRAHKAQGQKGSMSLGISVKDMCRVSDVPAGPLPMNIYMLTSETQSYTQLASNLDLHAHAEMAAALTKLEPCP